MVHIVRITNLDEYEVIRPLWIKDYKDDPSVNFFGTASPELEGLTAEVCIKAGIVGGEFYAAFDKDKIVGTALWYPPGSDALADQKQLNAAFTALEAMKKYKRQAHDWFLFTFVQAMQNPPKDYKRDDNWKLYSFTIAEEYEGKGVDKLLLEAGECQAAAQGLATCFEEMREDEVKRFKSFGYQIITQGPVDGPPGGDGFELFYLIKHPQE